MFKKPRIRVLRYSPGSEVIASVGRCFSEPPKDAESFLSFKEENNNLSGRSRTGARNPEPLTSSLWNSRRPKRLRFLGSMNNLQSSFFLRYLGSELSGTEEAALSRNLRRFCRGRKGKK